MSESTIIFDGSNPKNEHEEQTRIISTQEFKENVREKAESQKNTLHTLRNVGMAVGGLGVGMALMGFMPSQTFKESAPIPVPEEPQAATTVTDEMSYQEAFVAARQELGAGHYFVWRGNTYPTYTQEEWNRLDDEDKAEYQTFLDEQKGNESLGENEEQIPFVVHDQAPVAENVAEDMSFNDAFAIARHEVGPGGVFEWHGKLYNTYYENEWNSMDSSEKEHFFESVNQANLDSNNIIPSHIEHLHEAIDVNNITSETFLTDEYVTLETGETLHIGYFQQNTGVIVKLDVDGDNQYDYIVDPETEQLVGLNGNPDVALNQLINNSSDSDNISEPIMSEYVNVDGYNALVTTFNDGTQQAQIDLDGDGMFDTTLTLNPTTGEMNAYDVNGDLIAEDNIMRYDEVESYEDVDNSSQSDYTDYEYVGDLYADNQQDDFGDDFNNQMDINEWA
ncbi:hypothetical protein [Prevotella intermedia]|uniref:Uncharacterized protein n=1 Tax=Prevotella intermedia TaxID=28131 RepID=A0A2M8M8U9_PREIN|nr:hypothetical protein [Prevotella intermedia]PJF00616.1 hypothetical protein CUB97_04740 [Prevotella intermedia]